MSTFYFDEPLSAEKGDDLSQINRQLEIFTHKGAVYLRVGPRPDDTKGEASVMIRLSKDVFLRFQAALDAAGTSIRYVA
jgi:hypothetical protein